MATDARFVTAAVLALALATSQAAEIAGVKFDPELRAVEGGPMLQLNGAGLRRKFIFKVYAMGLYLAGRTGSAEEAIGAPGPKRVAIRMLRDVSAKTFSDALEDGLRANHSEAEFKALGPRVQRLTAIMGQLGEAKEGMSIALDWRPGLGTAVVVDGRVRGRPIAGEDFYRALLRIWLGAHPVQDDLKGALLGKAE